MAISQQERNQLNNHKVPDWEMILALYAPYVAFFIGIFNGNLATTLAVGVLQVTALFLTAIIIVNILYRTVKLEHGFALLLYLPIMRLGNVMSTIIFLIVVIERLSIEPVQSVVLFVLMFILLAYSSAAIELSAQKSVLAFGTDFLKMMFATGIVILITSEHGTFIVDQLEKLLGAIVPMFKSIHIDLLSVAFFFIGGGLFIWFMQVMFGQVARLVRYLLIRSSTATGLRIAVVFAQLCFAAFAIYL